MDDKEYFRPEIVDEQVDALLQTNSTTEQEARAVHDLQHLYQSDLQSLERVRQRLDLGGDPNLEAGAELNNNSMQHATTLSHRERSQPMQGQHTQRQGTSPRQISIQRFGLIAAVLVAALLVGSLIAALNITRGQQHSNIANTPHPGQIKTSSGLYIKYMNGVGKIDPMTGKTAWRYSLPQTKEMPQTAVTYIDLVGNTLFVIANQSLKNDMFAGGIVALNAQTGATLWQKQLPPTGAAVMNWNNMTVTNGTAYVVNTDHNTKSEIAALDVTTGALKTGYTFPLVVDDITGDNGRLYLGTNQGLYVVNAPDGKVVWKDHGTGLGQRYSVLPHIKNNVVYAAFSDGSASYIKTFNAQNGTTLWQSKKFDGIIGPSLIISGQQLYANVIAYGPPSANSIIAFNMNNGHVNWSTSVPSMAPLPPGAPEVINGVVYFPTVANTQKKQMFNLNALNAATGKRLWQKPIDQGPAYNQGVAYEAAQSNGIVYAGRLDTLPEANTVVISAYTIDGKRQWQIAIKENVIAMITPVG